MDLELVKVPIMDATVNRIEQSSTTSRCPLGYNLIMDSNVVKTYNHGSNHDTCGTEVSCILVWGSRSSLSPR